MFVAVIYDKMPTIYEFTLANNNIIVKNYLFINDHIVADICLLFFYGANDYCESLFIPINVKIVLY